MDHDDDLVRSLCEPARQVELGRVVRAFGIADELAVHIQVHAARDAEERNDIILIRVFDLKVPAVDAYKVVLLSRVLVAEPGLLVKSDPGKDPSGLLELRDDRRLERELVADIGVERLVVAAELPARRNIDLVESGLLRVKDFGHLSRDRIEFKIPLAVQAHHFGRRVALFFS